MGALLPLLSLGEDTAILNPKLSTSPIARRTNLVGQIKPIIQREIQRYLIMHKKSSEKTDTSILHHAFISIFIALWVVITHYISILMAILSYFTRFTMKRGNAGSWNLAGKGANIGNLFCTAPKILKLHETSFWN